MARMGQAKEDVVASDAELDRVPRVGVPASLDVTIIERDIQSPPDDPHHYPPAVSQVAFYRDGRFCRMPWHLAPRPRSEGSWDEEVLVPLSAEEVRA
jgi:hypothetical protein